MFGLHAARESRSSSTRPCQRSYTRVSFSAFASSCSFVIGAGSGAKIVHQAVENLPYPDVLTVPTQLVGKQR
jgi:hypothetical protein